MMQIVEHFIYSRTVRGLTRELNDIRPGHIVFLIGPSGVGKTWARYAALRELYGRPEYWGAGKIPVIDTYALLPSNAYYSSLDMAKTLDDQLNTPSLRWLTQGATEQSPDIRKVVAEVERAKTFWAGVVKRSRSEAEYWKSVGRQAQARGCHTICIDHATALLRNRANLQPAQHIEHLVSLAEEWGIMFVMTGVSRVHWLWEVHSELRRRIHKVWMPPYSHAREEDELHWSRLMKNLSRRHPLLRRDVIYELRDEILAATGGVIGEALQLLDRAYGRAIDDGRAAISAVDLRASYHGEKDLVTLWSDIAQFEEIMPAADVSSRVSSIRAAWLHAGKAREVP
jgi:hypothetical protein